MTRLKIKRHTHIEPPFFFFICLDAGMGALFYLRICQSNWLRARHRQLDYDLRRQLKRLCARISRTIAARLFVFIWTGELAGNTSKALSPSQVLWLLMRVSVLSARCCLWDPQQPLLTACCRINIHLGLPLNRFIEMHHLCPEKGCSITQISCMDYSRVSASVLPFLVLLTDSSM